MNRAALVLVVLAGCMKDRLVPCGEHLCPIGTRCTPTGCSQPIDAQFFDAPADAPYACPPLGGTPAFSPAWRAVGVMGCSNFTIGGGLAAAICQSEVETGPAEGPLVPANLPHPNTTMSSPRLSPEGDELFVLQTMMLLSPTTVDVYHLVGGAWTLDHPLGLGSASVQSIGVPSSGPLRHMFTFSNLGLNEIVIDATGTVTKSTNVTDASLGVTFSGVAPGLTPDGLRMVFPGYAPGQNDLHVFYADRPDLASPFSHARVVDTGPAFVTDPFMTGDCARLYFTAASAILFAHQQ